MGIGRGSSRLTMHSWARYNEPVICGRMRFLTPTVLRLYEKREIFLSTIEIFILAVGLAMDAFAASMCKGLAIKKISAKNMLTAGVYFGGFQALMPLVGYLLGTRFGGAIAAVDHWIAFVLLAIIGGNMIKSSFSEDEHADASMDVKSMTLLAVATSIDALAVGVTLAFLGVSIMQAVVFIGVTTFALSAFGVYLGNRLGDNNKINAELWGGVILIIIGLKILLEHLGFIG